MRRTISLITLSITLLSASAALADYVNGYTKKDGSYVGGYYRSPADGNPYNNYGSK